MGLDISYTQHCDAVIINLEGIVNTYNAEKLGFVIKIQLGEGIRKFIFDCSNLKCLDSNGLAVIYHLYLDIFDTGTIIINSANNSVKRLLAITEIDNQMFFTESLEFAKKYVSEEYEREIRSGIKSSSPNLDNFNSPN